MDYDVVIIGAGHNGLTASIALSKGGKQVLVLDKQEVPGGLAASYEFYPGYRSNGVLQDTSCVRTSMISGLGLDKSGLKTSGKRPTVAFLEDNGGVIIRYPDIKKTINSIGEYSKNDADKYLEYENFIEKIRGFIVPLMEEMQPDLTYFGWPTMLHALKKGYKLKRLGKDTMLEFLKVAPMSTADFLNEFFETDFLKAGLTLPALKGSFSGPWSSYTTLNLLLCECLSRDNIVGGPSQLIDALTSTAEQLGVKIQCGSQVDRIILDGSGAVKGVNLKDGKEITSNVVVATCAPREVFFGLLQSNLIGPALDQEISHLRSRGTTAKVNLALNKKIRWKEEIEDGVEYFRTGNSLDEVEQAFDAVKYNEISKKPVLDIYSSKDQSQAPDGHSVVSILVQFVPHQLKGGWTTEKKEGLCLRVIDILSEHTSGLNESIVGSEVVTPEDIDQKYQIPGGHLYHIEHAIDQLIGRPIPSCSQYKTPIKGLFLGGSGSHPGGGLICAPGLLASSVVLQNI